VSYFEDFLATAREHGMGFVLEAPTWRANRDWAQPLGLAKEDVLRAIDDLMALMADLRARWEKVVPIVLSACIGPRGDGYAPESHMTVAEAAEYHSFEIRRMAAGPVDMASALTITSVDEAVGIAEAARSAGLPLALSFTLETDGRLPDGTTLGEAIETTEAATEGYAAYYMVNCAHPTHIEAGLQSGAAWAARVRGVRANASTRSHAELDEAVELDDGDPADLAQRYLTLRNELPTMSVLGGCCGTDHRHVAAIAEAWATLPA
jgi:S-methylmethionine-dependent homocysteine/selenocysteine methylase